VAWESVGEKKAIGNREWAMGKREEGKRGDQRRGRKDHAEVQRRRGNVEEWEGEMNGCHALTVFGKRCLGRR
jgi:hypothetical protein